MSSIRSYKTHDLLILIAINVLACWYLWDSWRASTQLYNLISVLPLAVLILLVSSIALFTRAVASSDPAPDGEEEPDAGAFTSILLFAAYVLTLPWLGFDVGTFAYLAMSLWQSGERQWPLLIGYPAVFATGCALFFSYMLPYPMPMLLLPGGG